MLLKKYAVFFTFFLIGFQTFFAQSDYENFSFINIKEGFTKRAVSTIIQDSYGFIWFGTNGSGLYKYDGNSYNLYEYSWNNKFTINNNIIYSTYIDSKNQLWVGTEEGLNLYDRDLDQFKRIDLKKVFSPYENENIRVVSIVEDDAENLILGLSTYEYGLLKVSINDFSVSRILPSSKTKPGFITNNVAKDSIGEIYVATTNGLLKYDKKSNSIVEPEFNFNNNSKKILEPVKSLFVDSENNVWVGTDYSGIIKLSNQKNQRTLEKFPITEKQIMSIIELDKNTLLCGTENDGLLLINKKGEVLKKYSYNKSEQHSLKSNSIWSLYLDANDRIWIGYYNKGIGVYDKNYNKFNEIESVFNNPNSLQAGSVTGIVKDKSGHFLLSMDGGGVDMYNSKTKEFKHINSTDKSIYSGLKNIDIQTIFIDKNENIWLGSWSNGIYLLKKGTSTFINYNTSNSNITSNKILSFAEDSKGNIWFGTFTKGLHYYNSKENKFIYCNSKPFNDSGISNYDIRKVFIDSKDNIWVGSTSGLFKVIINEDNTFYVESFKEKMAETAINHSSTHHILSLFESKNGLIWIGTDGAGLFSYNQTNDELKWYNEIDGFNEKSVCSIIETEDHSIWISGKSGITKINETNAVNYTIDDGLLTNNFNYNSVYIDNNNTLYFGNIMGVNYFNPEQINVNTTASILHFTDFKLYNKHVTPNEKNSPLKKTISQTKSITLKHNQSVFTIDYIGINFTRSEKNKYAYFLEGFEKNWNYVGNTTSATYTNLAPGDYTFKVKASNNDGVWTQTPLELHIKILAPWWKTTLANILYLLAFALILFGLFKFLKRREKEKQEVIIERNRRLQEEKLNKKKLEFFTNISHEFRTPLTLIINPLSSILKEENYLSKNLRNKLQTAVRNSDRLSRLVDELMDFRKLESNFTKIKVQKTNAVNTLKNILTYFKEEAVIRNIHLNFDSSENEIEAWLDIKMFEKIIFNLLSNAFKYTQDKGNINVSITTNKHTKNLPLLDDVKTFEISIKDNGFGLNENDIQNIFKRFYQAENSNKSYYSGTGIGLEVVKNFVELHKGTIDVKSSINEGTEFIITFPLGNKHFNEEDFLKTSSKEDSNKKEENFTSIINSDKKLQLLIIEDNTELRNYLKTELEKYYKILTAENGKLGLKITQERLPDIILTDVVMPKMDGLELCRKIKHDKKTSHIPIVMLSAKTMTQDKLAGIDSGADAYISKPFNMDILKSTLMQLVESRQILFNKYFKGTTKKSKTKTTSSEANFMQQILEYINDNISEPNLNVENLAKQLFLSRSQLYRKVKSLTGMNVNEFIRNVRLEKAKQLIESGNKNINDVSFKVGFSSASYFSKCFKDYFGFLPKQLK